MSSNSPTALQCGVIGAGIAGLAAAIALRRAGHDVEVFEKSTFKSEIGAAITITPNGHAVLDKWGFDAQKAAASAKLQSRMLDPQTLQVHSQVDFGHVVRKYGHAFNAYHRVDLHNQLHEMALAHGAVIRLGMGVGDLNCEEGSLKFKDGSQLKKDLVIIADGIRSSFAITVSGTDAPVSRTNRSIFRGLIPMDRLMQDPAIRPVFENEKSGFCSALQPEGSGVFVITYPCRADKVMNMAIFHTTRPGHENDTDWNSPATKDEVVSILGGMNPFFKAIVQHADEMNCFPVLTRDVIPRFYNGKAIIIGDAAHPMQPTHAQGACVSLEDAAALEVMFTNWDSTTDKVERRAKLFSDFRLPRDNTTALVSNGMFYNGSMEDRVAQIRQYYTGPLLPVQIQAWTQPHQEFFYPYDVFAEANKAMAYRNADELPESTVRHFFAAT